MKRFLCCFSIILLLYAPVKAQTCIMNISTQKVCLGNTVSFSVSITGGGTITGYNWNFGNSATSTQATPIYQYTSTGTFTPSVTVNFAGGGSCIANGSPIKVVALPQTKFEFTTASTQCFNANILCITNKSLPGSSGAPLDTGNLNWDDGTKVYFNPVFGQIFCHTYNDPFGGIYTPVIEIADTNGCLSRLDKKDSITVFPKMGAVSFTANGSPRCPQSPYKFTNFTAMPKTMVKRFKWIFGDGSVDTTRWDTLTHLYTAPGSFDVKLIVSDINDCTDSFQIFNAAQNAVLDPIIHISPDDHSCFRKNAFMISSVNPGAQVNWAIYNVNYAVKTDTAIGRLSIVTPSSAFYNFPNCGRYEVRMYVAYSGSAGCKSYTDTIIDVYGPNAIAQNDTAAIPNQIQCQIHDTVYFRTPVPYLHCHHNNTGIKRLWDFGDVYAPQCTTDTKKGINVNTNCNWSKDSMNVWHVYTPGKEDCYKVIVTLNDTVINCWDSDTAVMKLRAPSAHWDSTVNPIRPGVYYTPSEPCIDEPVTFYFDKVLPQCGFDSAWLLPDSACHAPWIPVKKGQTKIIYTYSSTCDSSGWVTYGVVVRNGLNNFNNYCYDTAWYHYKLRLFPISPYFTAKVSGTCQPYTLEFNLIDSVQDSIITAEWSFETHSSNICDGGFNTILKTESRIQHLNPPNDSVIHSQTYISPFQGVVVAALRLTNSRNCTKSYPAFISLGYEKAFAFARQIVCLGDLDTLFDYVKYYNTSKFHWTDSARANANKEKIWWDIGDGNGFSRTGHNPVVKYTQPGSYTIRMAMQDSLGCRDTITCPDPIEVVSIDAQVKKFNSTQYCAPFFLNLFDSTIVIGNDNIGTWEWKFSDNKPRSLLQDPQHEFTSNGLFTVQLIVTTINGCVDTMTKSIDIKGPQPKFDIVSDTVGCRPFTAVFRNTTGYQLKSWQWNFRDQNNTVYSTVKDTDVAFTYSLPGIYNIRLFGIDTIRDPATNTLKSCFAYFPDTITGLPPRVIRVLPAAPAKIIGPDSICPNQVDTFIAQCDTSYNKFNWLFGDGGSALKTFPDTLVTHAYTGSGVYKMTLMPVSIDPKACIDTVHKTIYVEDVNADFEIDESQLPYYLFNNKSTSSTSYKWFIGNDLTNKFSEDKNTGKMITDTGAVMICLQAFNAQGCWDTICREVKAKAHIFIPNVFTPDNNDGKNDAFDIDIVGWSKYDIVIYNRWGTAVFKSDKDGLGNDGINWNGKEYNRGAQCASGTYFFVLKYKLINETSEKTVRGTVTLLRPEN